VREDPSAETLTEEERAADVRRRQPYTPAVQLRLQYAVLFAQEFDEIVLFRSIQPNNAAMIRCSGSTQKSTPNPSGWSFRTLRV
jgi:hypothetical protein